MGPTLIFNIKLYNNNNYYYYYNYINNNNSYGTVTGFTTLPAHRLCLSQFAQQKQSKKKKTCIS